MSDSRLMIFLEKKHMTQNYFETQKINLQKGGSVSHEMSYLCPICVLS